MGFSVRLVCKSGEAWGQAPGGLLQKPAPSLKGCGWCYCSKFRYSGHACLLCHPSSVVCSLVKRDIGLLHLGDLFGGHGSRQATCSVAQPSLPDLHELGGFAFIVLHTDLMSAASLNAVLETAGQVQSLQETRGSCPATSPPSRSFLLLLSSQGAEGGVPLFCI